MTSASHRSARRSAVRAPRGPRARRVLAVGAAMASFALAAVFAVAPPAPPSAVGGPNSLDAASDSSQVFTMPDGVVALDVARDEYSATAGKVTLARGGTNHDWARLVLVSGGWPVTEENTTVIVRWMRQENGTDSWWNRNNPLNNGYGSGGGSGLGSYASLTIAAEKAAENLKRMSAYSAIVDRLARSAPTELTEQAIWASPWASSHYANGAHWHYTPVPVVKAPAEAWGE